MIIVDTNVIAYLLIQGEHSRYAEKTLKKDSEWLAPVLWKSEFCNILSLYVRRELMSLKEAFLFIREAEGLMRGGEYSVVSSRVLQLANDSKCSAYDCEFVALAQELQLPLITLDKKILKQFPLDTISLKVFGK